MTDANHGGSMAAPPGGRAGRPGIRGYWTRHWRGQLPLARAVWGSGLLAYVFLLAPVAAILQIAGSLGPARLAPLTEPAAGCIAIPLAAWHLVGVWRSAGRVEAGVGANGPTLARAAAGLVLLGMIALAWLRIVPEAREAIAIAFYGDPRVGRHALRLLPGGTELEVAGGISIGIADELEAMLAANPRVRVIHLNSPGGRITDGLALEALIRRHGLVTYTATQCASACTLAFLGGRERWISATAVVGFHDGYYPGETPWEARMERNVVAAHMRRAGVSEDFIERASATAYPKLWRPTTAELLRSHFATAVSDGTQFAVSGIAASSPDEIEKWLLQIPGMAALRELEPATFEALKTRMAEIRRRGGTESELQAEAFAPLQPYFLKYLPVASEEVLAELVAVWVEEIDAALRSPRVDCYDVLRGTLGQAEARLVFDLPLIARNEDALAAVLESAATAPSPPLGPEAADAGMRALLATIAPRYGALLSRIGSDPLEQPELDHVQVCRMTADLYRAALATAPSHRGEALRALVSVPPGQMN